MRVSVSILKGNGNAITLCNAMAKGIEASGDKAVIRDVLERNMDGFDAAVLWGFKTECQDFIGECRERGVPWVYLDNGYQLRGTHFKVSINDRHPNDYLMEIGAPSTRFDQWGVTIKLWRDRTPNVADPIIVAGMSPKAAWSFGFKFEEYESDIIAKLRTHTKRPIIYRPKLSNSPGAKSIGGSVLSGKAPVEVALDKAHCVVTHHSNVGCDALLAGVPVFSRRGVARLLGLGDDQLDRLETPFYPVDRDQWAYNLAYCQWSAAEMVSGECWKYMRQLMDGVAHGK